MYSTSASCYVDAVGHLVELWDKDRASVDELIGTWVTSSSGMQCATFEWEDADYSRGESDPDVYLVYRNEAKSTSGRGGTVSARDGEQNLYPATTWRDGDGVNPDVYAAVECTSGRECDIFPNGLLLPTDDPTTPLAQVIMAVDSAQKTLQTYSTVMDDSTVMIEFPSTDCPRACAVSRTLIKVPAGLAVDGDRLTHEMGHVLQTQQFGQDDLHQDCTWGG
ncbi:hypothetical protein WMF37_50015 [Sorangium sp. So ce291]|uniref:hypothetical protein n=1 Tax=Sorangium sp. So ce291 TaxID=3133294 RepID=UPI003F5DC416